MSKLYVVTSGESSKILGVFSSKADAEKIFKMNTYATANDRPSIAKSADIDFYIRDLKFNNILELELDKPDLPFDDFVADRLRYVTLYQCSIDCENINIYDTINDKDIIIKKGDITKLPCLNTWTCLECANGISKIQWFKYNSFDILEGGEKVFKTGYRRLITASSEKSQEHAEELARKALKKGK